jgi:methyl-accepting chemotaxis protein
MRQRLITINNNFNLIGYSQNQPHFAATFPCRMHKFSFFPERISSQLQLFAAALVGLLLITAGSAYFRMQQIGQLNEQLQQESMAKVQTILETQVSLLNLVRRLAREPYTDDEDEKKRWLKLVPELTETFQKKLKQTETLATRPDEQALLQSIKKRMSGFLSTENDLVDLMKAGRQKESVESLMSEKLFRGHVNGIEADIAKLVALWNADAEVIASQATQNIKQSIEFLIVIVLISVVVAFAFSTILLKKITQPIKQIVSVLVDTEKTGRFDQRVNVKGRDELSEASHAFNRLMASLQSALGNINEVVVKVAQGNFSQKIDTQLKGDLQTTQDAVNVCVDSLRGTMAVLNNAMKSLKEGEFEASNDSSNALSGEFQQAQQTIAEAMLALKTVLDEVGRVMMSVAQGDLSLRVKGPAQGELNRLKDNLNQSLQALSSTMVAISNNTRMVAAAANQTSTAIGQIADSAQHQTSAISQVVTAVKQTAQSVNDVTRSTLEASRVSKASVTAMQTGRIKMDEMVQVVGSIAENSEKINKITEAIEKIANKTNLLSLNAAIEAARAGEQGKGFSVVAEEVGKLATSSAESSQEIARLVQLAVMEARRAVAAVSEVSQELEHIEKESNQTDGMLQRISAALEQQSSAVEEINASISSLSSIAQSNSAASEEITATVVELSHIADATRIEVEKFSL